MVISIYHIIGKEISEGWEFTVCHLSGASGILQISCRSKCLPVNILLNIEGIGTCVLKISVILYISYIIEMSAVAYIYGGISAFFIPCNSSKHRTFYVALSYGCGLIACSRTLDGTIYAVSTQTEPHKAHCSCKFRITCRHCAKLRHIFLIKQSRSLYIRPIKDYVHSPVTVHPCKNVEGSE